MNKQNKSSYANNTNNTLKYNQLLYYTMYGYFSSFSDLYPSILSFKLFKYCLINSNIIQIID